MAQFSYIAKNEDGEQTHGTIDAISVQAAREGLLQLGLEPDQIYENPLSEVSSPASMPLEPNEKDGNTSTEEPEPSSEKVYFPLTDTLRLYAGWLLASYAVVYALGYYKYSREIPFDVPYVQGLFFSPLILSFAFAAFLFLMLTSLQKQLKGGFVSGAILTLVGVGIFVLYRLNT